MFYKKSAFKHFVIFAGKNLCQRLFFIKVTGLFSITTLDDYFCFKTVACFIFAIIYSWQLSSSEKSLVGKKVHPYISKILQISFTQIYIYFFIFFGKAYAVLRAANRFIGSEIPKNNVHEDGPIHLNINLVSPCFYH